MPSVLLTVDDPASHAQPTYGRLLALFDPFAPIVHPSALKDVIPSELVTSAFVRLEDNRF